MATFSFISGLGTGQRRIIGLVVAMAVVGGAVFAHVWLGGKIAEIEETLAEGRQSVEEIQLRAREYLDSMKRKAALEEAIKNNDARVQTAIDSIARTVEAVEPQGSPGAESGMFDKVLRYEAKTTERPIQLGSDPGKKKKREKASDFVELSQPVEYSFVKFIDLVRFLEKVEAPDRLMYVSKLQITTKYMDPDFVQGKLTVSTFIYKPQKAEETEED